jgi:predicted dehydrogenase
MSITLNWGILGAGNISSQFVHDLCLNNEKGNNEIKHIVRSIGSSSKGKGQYFIESNCIKSSNNEDVIPAIQSYDEFFANDQVDVVYIGTPHPLHKDQVIQALENNKHVLCEKPFTINSVDANEIIQLAKKKKRFLMEAVWTRFFPSITLLKEYIFEDKVLGKINRLFVDFAYDADIENLPISSRLRDIKLGGGSLLDIGIYSITYARIFLDENVGTDAANFETKSFLTLDNVDKVDYTSSILMKYVDGKQGILTCSNYTDGKEPFLRLEGSIGTLEMWAENPACPKKFKITFKDNTDPIEYEDNSGYNGFIYEADAVAKDIAQKKLENNTMPLSETLLVMEIMDKVRAENGLIYPEDK